MMITENEIKIERTATYFLLGKINKEIKEIWFVFHGYGQLAKDFIKNFEVLQSNKRLIVAPEALNKFYIKSFFGKIGSTWMTKHNRENEIKDYVLFIDKLYEKIISELNDNVKIIFFGFSQGVHTAARFLDFKKPKIDEFILWSSSFPHNCNYKENQKYWQSISKKIFVGTKDKLISNTKYEEEKEFIRLQMLSVDFIKFDGGHEITELELSKFLKTK
ncbi:MAG: hypothetical protein CR986_06200 [Ignavibacteriae bacterium]|nr:MAG: hypothetical protein CR986_06200 [Ignavibacteriota bacterium]